jgi:hypothetical protein
MGYNQAQKGGNVKMKEYVRVSDILAHLQDYSHIDEKVLQAKAQLGTNVHEAIGDYAKGDFPILESEKAIGYFRSYERWHTKTQPVYHRMEQRFFCDKLMITGQIDAVVSTQDRQHMLIDFKTSYKANEEIWSLQAHFYWYLCHVNSIELHKEMQWINLQRSGGHPKIYMFEFNEFQLMRCIDLANKFWEDRENAKDIE